MRPNLVLGGAVAVLALAAASLGASPEPATQLELSRFVGTYRDVAAELGQVGTAPLVFDVASRSNELRIHHNLLELVPRSDGTFDARLRVEVEGWGDLVATTAGGQRLTDRVRVPRQSLEPVGRVAIERGAESFFITYLGGPRGLPLVVESRLGEQLLATCGSFAAMPLLHVDCSGLESAFRSVELPMPAVGHRFELGAEHLTAEERALLSRPLAGR